MDELVAKLQKTIVDITKACDRGFDCNAYQMTLIEISKICAIAKKAGDLVPRDASTSIKPVKHEPKIRHHDMECHCSCGGPWPCPETPAQSGGDE